MLSWVVNICFKVYNILFRFLLCRKIMCFVIISGYDIDKLVMVRFFEGVFDFFNVKGGMI